MIKINIPIFQTKSEKEKNVSINLCDLPICFIDFPIYFIGFVYIVLNFVLSVA